MTATIKQAIENLRDTILNARCALAEFLGAACGLIG